MSKSLFGLQQKLLIIASVVLTTGLTVFSAPMAQAATCVSQQWANGNTGGCVTDIQGLLNGTGAWYHYSGYSVLATDGDFGPLTEAQVKDFQGWTSLTKDGIVGPNTWSALCIYAQDAYIRNAGSPASLKTYAVNAGCNWAQ